MVSNIITEYSSCALREVLHKSISAVADNTRALAEHLCCLPPGFLVEDGFSYRSLGSFSAGIQTRFDKAVRLPYNSRIMPSSLPPEIIASLTCIPDDIKLARVEMLNMECF